MSPAVRPPPARPASDPTRPSPATPAPRSSSRGGPGPTGASHDGARRTDLRRAPAPRASSRVIRFPADQFGTMRVGRRWNPAWPLGRSRLALRATPWRATAASSRAERVEVLVGDGLVDMRPERLGRRELGGVGRQVDEAEALGHDEAGRAVPAGVVEHEQDHAVGSGARLAGEEREHVLEVARGTMPVERDQKLSPVAGETKAVTESHSKRWWPTATGRSPRGAPSRRRIGFSPMSPGDRARSTRSPRSRPATPRQSSGAVEERRRVVVVVLSGRGGFERRRLGERRPPRRP